MRLKFVEQRNGKNILQVDDAIIPGKFRNFEGRGDKYNREGDRNFALLIDDEEIADALLDDKNEEGASWNVKIKPPKEDGDSPFMFLPVKVKFNGRGPIIWLISGNSRTRLDEEDVDILDQIDIRSVSMDIRPYDGEINGKAFRAAYLQSMEVIQEIDRFSARYAEEEHPEE